MAESVRAFVALDLSPETRETVVRALGRLQRGGFREVRWVGSEGMHLTLKFLGAVPQEALRDVERALQRVAAANAPLTLGLGLPGVFPGPRAPRVVWLGLQGDLDALGRLQQGVEEALAPLGFPREERAFHPHVTLGRVREGARADAGRLLDALARLRPEPVSWRVQDVLLMRSNLTPAGAVYHRIAFATLGMGLSDSQ